MDDIRESWWYKLLFRFIGLGIYLYLLWTFGLVFFFGMVMGILMVIFLIWRQNVQMWNFIRLMQAQSFTEMAIKSIFEDNKHEKTKEKA